MPSYAVFLREGTVKDPAQMEMYQKKVSSTDISRFKMVPLVAYGKMETLEGLPPEGIVILEFPTMEDAKRWYTSREYQAAMPHRHNAADYRVVLVEGI